MCFQKVILLKHFYCRKMSTSEAYVGQDVLCAGACGPVWTEGDLGLGPGYSRPEHGMCMRIPLEVRAENKRVFWHLALAAKHAVLCSGPVGGADKVAGLPSLQRWLSCQGLLWFVTGLRASPQLYLHWKFNRLGRFSLVKSSSAPASGLPCLLFNVVAGGI